MNQCELVDKVKANGIWASTTVGGDWLVIKPSQASKAKELLKDYKLYCRVDVERARKPTRRYSSHFDFIKNYPVVI